MPLHRVVNTNPDILVVAIGAPAVELLGAPQEDFPAPIPEVQPLQDDVPDNIIREHETPPHIAILTDQERQIGQVTASAHSKNWYSNDELLRSDETEINGHVRKRNWYIRGAVENIYSGGNLDRRYSRLDIFLLMFPPNQITLMLQQINFQMQKCPGNNPELTRRELLRFFGVLLLITKYEFADRASLWATTSNSPYEIAPNFGKTGMPRKRFDFIWQNLRFGDQPDERPANMCHEAYRWLLIDDFVDNFNLHRQRNFIPSENICVDESMSRWYGQGGDWINHGLPMYVAIDRKPENGCEIQSSCCATSGIMLRLRLVKSNAVADGLNHDGVLDLNHGTLVLKYLIEPWLHSNRIVCADSYFSSVNAAVELLRCNTKFIGVVKQAHRLFPMEYLRGVQLNDRGLVKGVFSPADNIGTIPSLMAFVWVDRDRRYFISSCSNLSQGTPYVRRRWRQIVPGEDAQNVVLQVEQPAAAKIYYKTCGRVDQHNRDCQSTLGLERKLKTHDWAKRVGTSILSMAVVDSWKGYSHTTFYDANGVLLPNLVTGVNYETQKQFYSGLIQELIDNNCDAPIGIGTPRPVTIPQQTHPGVDVSLLDSDTGAPRSGSGVYLSPTIRNRKVRGVETNQLYQGNCRVCKMKTRHLCSVCKHTDKRLDGWICHSITQRDCFARHMYQKHSMSI